MNQTNVTKAKYLIIEHIGSTLIPRLSTNFNVLIKYRNYWIVLLKHHFEDKKKLWVLGNSFLANT